jgi:hypothetical protein
MKIFNPLHFIACALCIAVFVSLSIGFDLKKDWLGQKDKNNYSNAVSDANVLYCFFSDNFLFGDYPYTYPITSKLQIDNKVFKNGDASLRFDLDVDTFSGGAICLYKRVIDAKPYLKKGAVQFWIKGANGGEVARVSLIDDDCDRKKTVVRLPINMYGDIKKEWTFVSVPLKDFTRVQPCYWDSTLQREIPYDFNWDRIAEFRIESNKKENKSFRIWVDDVFIVKKQKKNPS